MGFPADACPELIVAILGGWTPVLTVPPTAKLWFASAVDLRLGLADVSVMLGRCRCLHQLADRLGRVFDEVLRASAEVGDGRCVHVDAEILVQRGVQLAERHRA